MAQGIKSQPNGYFEVGDLLYIKSPTPGEYIYYSTQPNMNAQQLFFTADSSNAGLFGQILDNEVEDLELDYITWLEFRDSDGKSGYVQRDSSLYTSKVNPEFHYPDKEKSGFDWASILTGISSVSNAILGIFNKSKNDALPVSGTDNSTTPPQTDTRSFWQKNGIYILVASLVGVLVFLIFKKPKTPTAPGNNLQKKLNPSVKL